MRTIYTTSSIDKDTEQRLWDAAIIVFDTNALLDFYYMTKESQEIMADILKFLSGRIWLPSQVCYEFQKNRESVMRKPITEKYADKDLQGNKLIADLRSYIKEWESTNYHPFVSDHSLERIKVLVDDIDPKVAEIKTIVAKEYQERKKEIHAIADDDRLKLAIDSLPKGKPFSYSEIKEIVKEGIYRYANQIPPGYEDATEKSGIRQYGDLIIWKEILRYAKENGKDIIFVCNDVKSDWVIADESSKDKRQERPLKEELGNPRRELLAEFEEETGQKIWIYQTSRFIEQIEKNYQPTEPVLELQGKLGAARDLLSRMARERQLRRDHGGDTLLVRCDTCGELFEVDPDDFNFDWDSSYADDRSMGCEMEYESYEVCECPNCRKQIDLTLQIWEYPVGIINYQNIEIDGGNIESTIDLSPYFSFDDFDTCVRCGERAVLNDAELCPDCEEEYNSFINSDD